MPSRIFNMTTFGGSGGDRAAAMTLQPGVGGWVVQYKDAILPV